jgi:hypothetical protein
MLALSKPLNDRAIQFLIFPSPPWAFDPFPPPSPPPSPVSGGGKRLIGVGPENCMTLAKGLHQALRTRCERPCPSG